AIVPLIVLMVWMGTFTQSFMPPIDATNARLLQQSVNGIEVHVKREMKKPHAVLVASKESGDAR
ncbi:MAG: Fe-S-binding domain-containing protein, partial [Bryobacteraceae bacterium]